MCTNDERYETHHLAERFIHVFESSFKHMSQKRPHHQPFKDLSLNKFFALNILYHQPGMAQKDLAGHLHITPAAVSTFVRDLENMSLIERKPDQADARLMRLYLSDDAYQSLHEAIGHRRQAIAQLLAGLPVDEQHMIVTALEKALKIYLSHETHPLPDVGAS